MSKVEHGSWAWSARSRIQEVHKTLPQNISFADRKKAIFDAYPFGSRDHHPYKMWLKEQKRYLAQYDPNPPSGGFFRFDDHLSPMERMMQKAGAR